MRAFSLALAAAALAACSSEDFERLKDEAAPVRETSHLVTARFERGAVVLTVTRTFQNPGLGHEELRQPLALPDGAVVTSLRIDGHREELLDAEEADERWATLRQPGLAEPTVSARLSRWPRDAVRLELYGLAPQSSVTLAYDVQLPPDPEDGQWRFTYPADEPDGVALAAPTFDLTRMRGAMALTGLGETVVHFPRAPIDRVDAKWAVYRLSAERAVWRFELDAASVLEPAPVRPNVVFVVDASHSMGVEGIAGQLDVLAPYLASAPDAQVEVVLYRRVAERLFGRFVPASDVVRLLGATPAERLAPGNGSNLEAGARLAADLLAATPGIGRIVLFTDDELRDGFTNEAAIAALAFAPKDAVTHVVVRDAGGGSASESRPLDHHLGPIAAPSGGMLLTLSGDLRAEEPAAAAELVRGMVRPVRIDEFQVEAKGLEGDRLDAPVTLDEGDSERYQAVAARPPAEVTLSGKIWGRDFKRVLPVDLDLAGWLPGIALGTRDLEAELTDAEVRDAALRVHAVSRMTTYLSTVPGAGASTIGVEEGIGGTGGYGIAGFGCSSRCGGIIGIGGRSRFEPPDYAALLRSMMADGLAGCARTHGRISGSVTIEATRDEVVDVTVAAETAELATCIGEVAWALRLTEAFRSHRTYEVPLE